MTADRQAAAAARCDLIVTDATILSPGAAPVFSGAIAISAETIVAIGPAAKIAHDYVAARTVSAEGGLVMPGMVNTHNHSPLMIVRGVAPDLGFAPAYVKGIPQGGALALDDALALARLGVLEMLRLGSTTIVDFYLHPNAVAQALEEMGVRGFVGGRIMDADDKELAAGRYTYDVGHGMRLLEDSLALIDRYRGRADGRIQGILAPHAPDTCSTELLRTIGAEARARGLTLHTHLAQSGKEVECVRARDGMHPVELLEELGLLGPDLLAAHCTTLGEPEIARIGGAQASIAHAPMGNAAGGMVAPIHRLAEAGARITLCTDSKSGDMFEAMRAALWMTRISGAGFAVTAPTVFEWATLGGATALGLGESVGRLEPGYKADLLILDARAPNLYPVVDGIGVVVHLGSGHNVRHATVDGRFVLWEGVPTLASAEEIIAEAQAVADRLWRDSPVYAKRTASA